MEQYILGVNARLQALIDSGRGYRDGGVVRHSNGSIAGFLNDRGQVPDQSSAASFAVLGLGMGAISRQLATIQADLARLAERTKALQTHVAFVDLKADADLLGTFAGTVDACGHDIAEARLERLPGYRQTFQEAFRRAATVVKLALAEEAVFRAHPDAVVRYFRFAVLAGVAARDVSVEMGEVDTARSIGGAILEFSRDVSERLAMRARAPSASFWIAKEHLVLVPEARETTARLAGHVEALRLLPLSAIRRLACEDAQ